MARPLKDGVNYFNKDTDFYQDNKIRLLRAQFGAKGMYVLDFLLCELYGKNGYYLPWNTDVQLLVADAVGCECSSQFIGELIVGATKCSFFDKRVLDVFNVLTSAGIQRRYIRMFNSRNEIYIFREYWLLNKDNKKDVPTNVFNKLVFYSLKSTDNPDKSTVNSQSKVKESKGKKKKGTVAFAPPTLEEIISYCRERNNDVDPKKFYDYFQTSNWVDSKGNKVANWKQKIITWEGRNGSNQSNYQTNTQTADKYSGISYKVGSITE